jgi:CRP-like cAMP-binding protein
MAQPQSSVTNRLLRALSCDDYGLLDQHLVPVEFQLRDVISEADAPITDVYFLENCIVSVVAQRSEDRIEVGMVGREGLVNPAAAFGATHSAFKLLCQRHGTAFRLSAEQLRLSVQQSPTLAAVLGRYLYYLTIQTAQTAYSNASLNMEARLARWILMTDDRSDGYELTLTHDFMAIMLGARRPSVTTAMHVLEGAGMIRAERGIITVLNRDKLEDLSDGSYGVAESEYDRLIVPA